MKTNLLAITALCGLALSASSLHASEEGGLPALSDRVDALEAAVQGNQMPLGSIMMYAGAEEDIPLGWALCDGTRNTPDLRDKFVVGSGGDLAPSVGVGGGAETHAHDVVGATNYQGVHSHATDKNNSTTEWVSTYYGRNTDYQEGHLHGISHENTAHQHNFLEIVGIRDSSTHNHDVRASGAEGEIIPPYYGLAYIMKVAIQ